MVSLSLIPLLVSSHLASEPAAQSIAGTYTRAHRHGVYRYEFRDDHTFRYAETHGYSEAYSVEGRWKLVDGELSIEPDTDGHIPFTYADTLAVVSNKTSTFLTSAADMPSVCESWRTGHHIIYRSFVTDEFMKHYDVDFPRHHFDDRRLVDGIRIPSKYERFYKRGPIVGKVDRIGTRIKNATYRIDKGSRDGVFEGLLFYGQESWPKNWYRVLEVKRDSATLMLDLEMTGHRPREGTTLTTAWLPY